MPAETPDISQARMEQLKDYIKSVIAESGRSGNAVNSSSTLSSMSKGLSDSQVRDLLRNPRNVSYLSKRFSSFVAQAQTAGADDPQALLRLKRTLASIQTTRNVFSGLGVPLPQNLHRAYLSGVGTINRLNTTATQSVAQGGAAASPEVTLTQILKTLKDTGKKEESQLSKIVKGMGESGGGFSNAMSMFGPPSYVRRAFAIHRMGRHAGASVGRLAGRGLMALGLGGEGTEGLAAGAGGAVAGAVLAPLIAAAVGDWAGFEAANLFGKFNTAVGPQRQFLTNAQHIGLLGVNGQMTPMEMQNAVRVTSKRGNALNALSGALTPMNPFGIASAMLFGRPDVTQTTLSPLQSRQNLSLQALRAVAPSLSTSAAMAEAAARLGIPINFRTGEGTSQVARALATQSIFSQNMVTGGMPAGTNQALMQQAMQLRLGTLDSGSVASPRLLAAMAAAFSGTLASGVAAGLDKSRVGQMLVSNLNMQEAGGGAVFPGISGGIMNQFLPFQHGAPGITSPQNIGSTLQGINQTQDSILHNPVMLAATLSRVQAAGGWSRYVASVHNSRLTNAYNMVTRAHITNPAMVLAALSSLHAIPQLMTTVGSTLFGPNEPGLNMLAAQAQLHVSGGSAFAEMMTRGHMALSAGTAPGAMNLVHSPVMTALLALEKNHNDQQALMNIASDFGYLPNAQNKAGIMNVLNNTSLTSNGQRLDKIFTFFKAQGAATATGQITNPDLIQLQQDNAQSLQVLTDKAHTVADQFQSLASSLPGVVRGFKNLSGFFASHKQ